jgi:hypothetical protein
MSAIDLIKEWGEDSIIAAMRDDEWFALDVFDAIADATELAKKAAAFGRSAEKNGCIVIQTEDLPDRLRRLADIFEKEEVLGDT